VLKVVPEADAKLQGVPTYVGNTTPARGDQVVTQVFQLRNESANNLLPVLRPLISPNNTIAAYPANNTLVVTDYADNIQRLAAIIAGIDSAAGTEIAIVPLKNANAIDIAQLLSKLLDPGAIGSTDASLKVSVSADPRTNSLMMRASNRERLTAAKKLALQLDAPSSQPGNMHVVHLRYASAVDLAKTLRGMLGKGGGESSSTSNSASSFNQNNGAGGAGAGSTGTAGTPPLPSGSSGLGGGSALGGSNPLGGGSGNGGYGNQGFGDNKGGEEENQPGGMIQADPATNSLIITAADPVYRNLRAVIDQLDARRAQVYIEALIVELSATNSTNLGIQWQGALLSNGGNNGIYGGSNFNNGSTQSIVGLTGTGAVIASNPTTALTTIDPNTLLSSGLNVGILHRFGNIFGLGGLLQALSQSSDANVLSTPNLITLDNEEAKIIVGENIPLPSGSYATPTASASVGVTAFNTFDREDIGTVLHVKPQITEGGLLKLQLYTEVSSIDPNSTNAVATGGYTIDKRSVQSTVLCDNGEIIVLGGLISDNYQANNQKVPLLGDIPWIGQLFRSENKMRTKDNLMIFLRPIIVRDQDDSTAITMNRYNMMRGQQQDYSTDNRLVRDKDVPQLPNAPATPAQGANPADNLIDLSHMTRQPQVPNPGAPATPSPAAPAPILPPPDPSPDPSAPAGNAPPGGHP
jgi:general secretion pathway protein D